MAYLERPSLFLDNGVALLRDSSFGDGTIEFDVALHGHASFAGVAFRALSGDDYELDLPAAASLAAARRAAVHADLQRRARRGSLYSGPGYTADGRAAARTAGCT